MKTTLRILCVLLFYLPLAVAQFTTVIGTITDPNGLPYAFGTIVSVLVTSASPTLNGLAYTPPTQPVGLDRTGSFTMQLADNTVLLPPATKWNFTVCSAIGTILPAGGKGPVCFSLASPITISGASQSITANLNAVALALGAPGSGGATVNPTNNVIPKRLSVTAFADSALIDNGTNITSSEVFNAPAGTAALPSFSPLAGGGMFSNGAGSLDWSVGTTRLLSLQSTGYFISVPFFDFATGNTQLNIGNGLVAVNGFGGVHANFGFNHDKGQHLVSQAAQADSWGVATCAANTVTVTFTIAYTSTPAIVVTDETTTGGARVSAKSNSAFTITCTGATDVVDYFTGGNPN